MEPYVLCEKSVNAEKAEDFHLWLHCTCEIG